MDGRKSLREFVDVEPRDSLHEAPSFVGAAGPDECLGCELSGEVCQTRYVEPVGVEKGGIQLYSMN